jgi:transcriptional regulator with XRE-family HTH domain
MALDTEIPSRKVQKPKHPIADWTRQRRKVLGLSQSDVAARMSKYANTHVDANYLALIERGRIEAPRKHLRAFALALETTEDQVLQNAGVIPADESAKEGARGINPFAPGTLNHETVELLREHYSNDEIAFEINDYLKFLIRHPQIEDRLKESEKVPYVSGLAPGLHKHSKATG